MRIMGTPTLRFLQVIFLGVSQRFISFSGNARGNHRVSEVPCSSLMLCLGLSPFWWPILSLKEAKRLGPLGMFSRPVVPRQLPFLTDFDFLFLAGVLPSG